MEKNPLLKDKLPEEGRYYKYDRADGHIYITATDGSRWKLNLKTLLATETNDDPEQSAYDRQLAALEKAEKANRDAQDSLYRQKSLRPADDYRLGRINSREYQQIQKLFYAEREQLSCERDSLQ